MLMSQDDAAFNDCAPLV